MGAPEGLGFGVISLPVHYKTKANGSSPPSSTDASSLTLPSGIQLLGIEDWFDRIAAEVAA